MPAIVTNPQGYLTRDLGAELGGLYGQANTFAGANYNTQAQWNPALTALNTTNYTNALLGGNIDTQAFLAAHPEFSEGFNNNGQSIQWLQQAIAAAGYIKPGDVPRTGGAADLASGAYGRANPGLVQYTGGLQTVMDRLNSQAPGGVTPAGYDAATASPSLLPNTATASASPSQFVGAGAAQMGRMTPAQAYQAAAAAATASTSNQQFANGGPLLNPLQGDAAMSLNRLSPLQQQQQDIAGSLLRSGGDLSAQDLRNVQQDTRGAYAARGLFDSNQAIGAEIMNTDAARRQRLQENLGIAQGVDTAGQAQINAARGYASNVQGQGQNLSTFNAGQGNQVGMANASLLTNTSTFNAGQQNDTARFNAGLLSDTSKYNAGLATQLSSANASAANDMSRYNAGAANQSSQFNSSLLNNTSQFNAGALNQGNQYGASLLQNNNQYNAGQQNAASQFNTSATNQGNQFNATLQGQNANDAWTRAMQYGGLQLSQAQNPNALAGALAGQTPDYTGSLLNYGSDVYNTNYNAINAARNSAANNSAGKTSGLLGAAGAVGGAYLGYAAQAKMTFLCVPEGVRIDTKHGGVSVENVKPGMRVIGYDGEPVLVLQVHQYLEDPTAHRFLSVELLDGNTLNVCDKHRVQGRPAGELVTGARLGENRVKSVTRYGGVRRSYDLLTEDAGYRIASVPVNSMIEEMAAYAAQLRKESKHAV